MWIALTSESRAEALEYSEQSLAVAATPLDHEAAIAGKACALMLLRQTDEAAVLLEEVHRRCIADGNLYLLTAVEPSIGLCEVLRGNISKGIRLMEDVISKLEKTGNRTLAGWVRLNLAEVHLQIIAGSEKPPFPILLKNLPILLSIMVTGSSRIRALIARQVEDPHLDPAAHHVGRAKMILGLLYKAKKKRALALQHLTEAKRIFLQFGQTPILARVETALAELAQ
jgi:hypothetical protein